MIESDYYTNKKTKVIRQPYYYFDVMHDTFIYMGVARWATFIEFYWILLIFLLKIATKNPYRRLKTDIFINCVYITLFILNTKYAIIRCRTLISPTVEIKIIIFYFSKLEILYAHHWFRYFFQLELILIWIIKIDK